MDKLAIIIEAPDPGVASSFRGDLWQRLAPPHAWRLCSCKQMKDRPYTEELVVEVPDATLAGLELIKAPTDERVKVLSKRAL